MWGGASVPLDSLRRSRTADQRFRIELTATEKAVTRLADEGLAPAEIARLRGTSIKTVREQLREAGLKRVNHPAS